MLKRILAALLCLIIVLTLLPTAALATEYDGWDNSQTYTAGDTITINKKRYTYKGDATSVELGLTESTGVGGACEPLTDDLVWTASDGYILYSYNETDNTAAVTLHDAASSEAICLPYSRGSGPSAKPTACATTVTLEGDSTLSGMLEHQAGATTFTGSGSLSITGSGISYFKGAVNVTGGARVTLGDGTSSTSVKIYDLLEVNGGTLTVAKNTKLFSGNSDNPTAYPGGIKISGGTLINNGTLILPTDTNVEQIKGLKLTGSGSVKVMGNGSDIPDSYYTNTGERIHKSGALDFTVTTGFDAKATLDVNGYTYKKEDGSYTITLGNLLINPTGTAENAIVLPNDGKVTVELVAGTTTRLIVGSGSGMVFDSSSTITGSGELIIQAAAQTGGIHAGDELVIEGGDITITNTDKDGVGINAVIGGAFKKGTVIIKGGKLNITGNRAAIRARVELTIDSPMTIISPTNGGCGELYESNVLVCYTIFNASDTEATHVVIGSAVNSVTVNPATPSVAKGNTQQFTATVTGVSDPAQTVTWSVEGGIAGTSIDANGVLTVAENETATTLTVTATSTVDTTKSGTATVTVTPKFVPVGDLICDFPTSVTVNTDLILSGTVKPTDATYKTVVWCVKDAGSTGATITNSVFRATAAGTAVVTATITKGASETTDYTKEFTFIVEEDPVPIPAPAGGSAHTSASGSIDRGSTYTGRFTAGANGAFVLTVQADCEKLTNVVVDGVQLTREKDYTAASGSTIITLSPAYLASLKDGVHTVRVQFTDGRYDGTFITPLADTIAPAAVPDVPATGDDSVPSLLLGAALLGFATGLVLRRKRQNG